MSTPLKHAWRALCQAAGTSHGSEESVETKEEDAPISRQSWHIGCRSFNPSTRTGSAGSMEADRMAERVARDRRDVSATSLSRYGRYEKGCLSVCSLLYIAVVSIGYVLV